MARTEEEIARLDKAARRIPIDKLTEYGITGMCARLARFAVSEGGDYRAMVNGKPVIFTA